MQEMRELQTLLHVTSFGPYQSVYIEAIPRRQHPAPVCSASHWPQEVKILEAVRVQRPSHRVFRGLFGEYVHASVKQPGSSLTAISSQAAILQSQAIGANARLEQILSRMRSFMCWNRSITAASEDQRLLHCSSKVWRKMLLPDTIHIRVHSKAAQLHRTSSLNIHTSPLSSGSHTCCQHG